MRPSFYYRCYRYYSYYRYYGYYSIYCFFLLEYHMAVVDREGEVEVIYHHRAYTEVILDVGVAVVAFHDGLHISRTVVAVGDISRHLGTIHSP